jgi:hypothetical protein
MAVVRTSHRATEERGTIIELSVQHQARRGSASCVVNHGKIVGGAGEEMRSRESVYV